MLFLILTILHALIDQFVEVCETYCCTNAACNSNCAGPTVFYHTTDVGEEINTHVYLCQPGNLNEGFVHKMLISVNIQTIESSISIKMIFPA